NWVAWWYHPDSDPGTREAEVADQLAELAVAMLLQTSLRTPDMPGPKAALALLRQDLDYLERTLDERGHEGS
ncbi:hypothetical protein, partial [Streptomyces sp. NPDC002588]|uniref:hypothetical protein n=1 Tax=Streptomyces sp. NPDC002588 TaxID=3154419 RepID=UPI00332245B7